MNKIKIKIKKQEGFADFMLPMYTTHGAAAMDLYAAIPEPFIYLWPNKRKLISTGIAIALPEGYEAQVRPRSGLAWKHGITLVNSPGTIDSDYRGIIKVILINHGEDRVKIDREQRIAQLVVTPVTQAIWVEGELCETKRYNNGFGSTGTGRKLEGGIA